MTRNQSTLFMLVTCSLTSPIFIAGFIACACYRAFRAGCIAFDNLVASVK